MYRCPHCHESLSEKDKFFVCPNGHLFDRAKQGYVNLLCTNNSKNHGDDREMVEARRDFLDSGAYLPLAQAIRKEAEKYGGVILDAGCGEGYYTSILSGIPGSQIYGTDISKTAVIHACKRTNRVKWSVSSVYDLPFADGVFDAVVSIFSPLAHKEYRRVLKDKGKLILAVPLEEHLWELKSLVYDKPYLNKPSTDVPEGFRETARTELRYEIKLTSNSQITALFSMTPYRYNTSPQNMDRLKEINFLTAKAQFAVITLEKI